MFDVGFSEMVLIGIVALLVLGPERLPGAARTLGAWLRKARQSFDAVRSEVERELRDEELKKAMQSVPKPSETIASLNESLQAPTQAINEAISSVTDGRQER
jgi:sec-independent protein translocase protein TatB